MKLGRCKASGCETRTPIALHFCAKHWAAIPNHLRTELQRHERAADAAGEDVSDNRAWMAVFHDVLGFLALNEGRVGAKAYHDRAARMYREPLDAEGVR